MANEFDYASIIADPNLMDPEYDISNIRTTTPTSERLLAAVPEYSGLKFDPTQKSVYSDLYSLYSGGLDSYLQNVDPSTGTVDTSVGTGGGGGSGPTLPYIDVDSPKNTGVNPFADIDTGVGEFDDLGPVDTTMPPMLDPTGQMGMDSFVDTTPDYSNVGTSNPRLTARGTPISEMGTRPPDFVAGAQTFTDPDPGATNPRVSQEVRDALAETPPGGGDPDMFYDEPVNLIERDPMGNPRLSGAKTVTTTPDYTYDPMDPPMLGDEGASMDYMSGALDAPYGVNPNTGIPYQTPRTIADQLLGQTFEADEVDEQGNLLQRGVEKLKSIIPNFDPIETAFKFGFNTLVGKPVTLLVDLLGPMLPKDTSEDTFNRQFAIGGQGFQDIATSDADLARRLQGYSSDLNQGQNIPGKDPFGRNTVSAFGDYEKALAEDLQYTGDNQFNLDKKSYAQAYFDKKGIADNPNEAKTFEEKYGISPTGSPVTRDILIDEGIEAADEEPGSNLDLTFIAAAEEAQRIENERAANARENARAEAAREAAAQAEAEARAVAREKARQPAPTYTPPSPHYDRPSGDNQGGNTGSGGHRSPGGSGYGPHSR